MSEKKVKFGIKTKISIELRNDLDKYSLVTGRPKTWILRQAFKCYLNRDVMMAIDNIYENKIL